jgi:hypothetical protein
MGKTVGQKSGATVPLSRNSLATFSFIYFYIQYFLAKSGMSEWFSVNAFPAHINFKMQGADQRCEMGLTNLIGSKEDPV